MQKVRMTRYRLRQSCVPKLVKYVNYLVELYILFINRLVSCSLPSLAKLPTSVPMLIIIMEKLFLRWLELNPEFLATRWTEVGNIN